MLLKSFECKDNNFLCVNPLIAHGFVQIKKEQQNFSVVIKINNFVGPTNAYLVSNTNVAKIKIESSTTIFRVGFSITENSCLFIQQYNLFACKNGTIGCLNAYNLALQTQQTPKSKTTLEKIFGQVYDTYFFDCIKPKLAQLFIIGKPVTQLSEQIECSKWISVLHNNQEKVFGVVYKNNFAYAIAVGSTRQFVDDPLAKPYRVGSKIYNILFLSASNGKIISF